MWNVENFGSYSNYMFRYSDNLMILVNISLGRLHFLHEYQFRSRFLTYDPLSIDEIWLKRHIPNIFIDVLMIFFY